MQKIYIDISNVIIVNFITGIQRVVRNVVLEFLSICPERIVLLSYSNDKKKFFIVDNQKFKLHFNGEKKLFTEDSMLTKKSIEIKDIDGGDIFFDIDSVWNSMYRRSILLPELKKYGVKIASFIHDIIPVLYPYSHINTTFSFLNYLGAHLQYSDFIVTSTQSVLNDIYKLCEKLNVKKPKGGYSWLGSNFHNEEKKEKNIDKEVIEKTKGKKYVLCVGTIEPRKNLEFVLDNFEKRLFDEGITLVFAGKIGWNVKSLTERIKTNPQLNKNFFHFEGKNDATIDYLYKNALLVAFPTYDEGFGLPMIEAIERKIPVIASDRPVLREVSGDLADYFELNNEKEFIDLVLKYANDKEFYKKRKENLSNYKIFTWHDTAIKIINLLDEIKPKKIEIKKNVKQLFCITARKEVIENTLKYVDKFMPFIKEVVLCCPDYIKKEIEENYNERMSLSIITDSEVLNGEKLPEDHQLRNTYLRIKAMKNKIIDDVFIMSDDDNRPLKEINKEYYINNDKYIGYYCYELDRWKGTEIYMTSYDYGIKRTAEFLKNNNYPLYQYSSHMPQIIDKKIYLEMVEKHEEIINTGFDEWSIYFNYLQKNYPNNIEIKPYITMAWPALGTDWDMIYEPKEYAFENFYDALYEENQIFSGYSKNYTGNAERENFEKIKKYSNHIKQYFKYREKYKEFKEKYEKEYEELPSFGIRYINNTVKIDTPQYMEISKKGFLRIPFYIDVNSLEEEEIILEYGIFDDKKNILLGWLSEKYTTRLEDFELPVYSLKVTGEFLLGIKVNIKNNVKEVYIPLYIV